MRRTLSTLLLSALLLVAPAWSADGPERDAASRETSAAPQSGTKKKSSVAPRKSAEKAATEALSSELQQLRQMLTQQAQQMAEQQKMMLDQQAKLDALTHQLTAAQQAAASATSTAEEVKAAQAEVKSAAAATAELDAQQNNRLVRIEKDADGTKKSILDKIKGVGPFTFSGDFRLRDEPFFGGPSNQSQVRNRERYRLRFNVNAKFNDDFSGGFALATGDINDPISTNQTTNQFYTRKPFALDRAFINYTPHQFKPLLLTGGKFAYPWYRTELTWDNDLNPEGLAQTLQWNFESTPVLKRIALVGFELPFTEVAGVSATNKSIVQSAVYGGQVQAVWQLAGWLKLSTYGAFYNYHNADPIALAVARASLSNPTTPAIGTLPLASNAVQNSITTTTSTSAITIEQNGVPTLVSTGVKTITNAQFASKFGLFDGIARFDIKTAYPRIPLVVLGDYVQNTRACANVGNIIPAPAKTATATFTQTTNAACHSRERRGYWLEARAGRLSEVKDIQVSYTRMFVEREAVMGVFNFSDMRQATNVSQHRVEFLYQAYKNIQLGFTGLFGRPLNFNSTTPPENTLKRLQFDVVYKF